MITGILLNIGKYFLIDLAIIAGLLVLAFFVDLLITKIRNGKSHKLTKTSVVKYTYHNFFHYIGRNLCQFIKWIVILFVIHLILVFLDSILGWAQNSVTYETVPLVALAVDILRPIVSAIVPIIFPIIAALVLIVLIYALAKTVQGCVRCGKKTTTSSKVALFGESFQQGLLGITKFLPKLFIVIVVCVGLNSVFLSINNISKIIDDYEAIQEMNLTVKNLSSSESFVRVSMIKESSRTVKGTAIKGWSGTVTQTIPVKTYKIEVLNSNGDVISQETMDLDGNQIVIDSININFDYSKIANGEKFNIAYPYRVYSEIIPASRAKNLNCMFNDKQIPVIYCLENQEIYGVENDVFYSRLAQLFDIIKNENKIREIGIRSTVGNAIHLTMHKGDVYDISIEGTGGLSLSKHQSLLD